jgi:hypothetical protein
VLQVIVFRIIIHPESAIFLLRVPRQARASNEKRVKVNVSESRTLRRLEAV